MNTLNSFVALFNNYRKRASLPSQIAVVAAGLLGIAAVIGVGIWSSQPHYVPFLQNVPPEEMAAVVAELDKASIKYKLSFSGKDILVDKSKWNRANLAAGQLAPGIQAEPNMPSHFLDSPDQLRINERHYHEKRLAANLARIDGVESALVHLSIADDSPFTRERQASTASVILKLRQGYRLTREKSQGIIGFVANSDKSLQAENVQLLDDKGNAYSQTGGEEGRFASDNYEMQKQVEDDKAYAAQALLEKMLGPGKAAVKVSAVLNLEKNTLTTKTIDADSQAKESETIDKIKTQDAARLAVGPPGTQANLTAQPSSQGQPLIHESEKTNIIYDNSTSTSTTEILPGEIIRLTVAVTYDPWAARQNSAPGNESGANAAKDQPAVNEVPDAESPPFTDKEIEAIVKKAVGFDEDRGDEITVIRAKLADSEFASLLNEQPASYVDQYGKLARDASLGIAAVLAFLFGLITLRKLRPVTLVTRSESSISPERVRQLSEITALARQHPEVLGKIMAAWMNESVSAEESSPQTRSRAA